MSLPEKEKALAEENEKILAEIRSLPDKRKKLDLFNCPLTSLAGVKLPSELKSLNLSFTKISDLRGVTFPDGLKNLTLTYTPLTNLKDIVFPDGLEELWLNGVGITNLDGVKLPKNLRTLILSNTKLTSLQGTTFPENLDTLFLHNTPLQDLLEVSFPTSLSVLRLDHTKLTKIPSSIKNLNNLRYLDVSGLHLTELPDWLSDLRLPFTLENDYRGIVLENTTVEGVDMSIFDQSQETILEWFKEYTKKKQQKTQPIGIDFGNSYSGSWEQEPELTEISDSEDVAEPEQEEAKPLNELKVVFLGDGEAGKTHTIARLLNDGAHVGKFRSVSTPGIVIEDKEYTIGDRQVKVHYWDFGGQEILHSMHRMFLTDRTLYVVVLNVREGNQDDRARYWLHNLRSFAGGAPVLLVLNKMDMNKNASVNETDLRKLYPGLTKIVKLSTLTYNQAKFQSEFIDVLKEQVGTMEILDAPLIAAGKRVKEKLQNMEDNYIKGDIFRQYCNECGVQGSDNVRRDLLDVFGNLGVSFCYSDSMDLEDHVVLKPSWITNAIYIILFNKVESVKNGMVSHDAIYRMLTSKDMEKVRRTVTDATYKRDEVDYVLKVFRKFRLSFRVEDEDMEFMPMLCDANATAASAEYEDDPNALEFRMHYEYLPNNVIHRLMVERRAELDRSNVWFSGARFVCGETGRSAVVKTEGNLLRILVRAEKDPRDPQRYLDELKDNLERINAIMGLTVAKTEIAYKEGGKTEYLDYETVLMEQEFGGRDILSKVHRKRVLLADVLMQSDFPEDEKQEKLFSDIRSSCQKLQNRKIYYDASEDQRTDYLMDMLSNDYFVSPQYRGGISAGGIQSGELDLDIRLNSADAWTALEALNLKGSSPSQIEYWNAHLKKLLDNYNEVGRAFLFHVSYVSCAKDKFHTICNGLYEHLRFYSPRGFELLRRFVTVVHSDDWEENRFLRTFKCVYDCGGIPMTVYHFFVRIGE